MGEEHTEREPPWSEAVTEAAEHAARHQAAADAALAPRDSGAAGLALAATLLVFAGVLAWDFYALSRPPTPPPAAEEAGDLRWFVADAVDLIEDFRQSYGRLPTRADLGDLLPAEILYGVRGETYSVSMVGLGTRVEYDGSTPIERWLDQDTVGGAP